MSASLSLSLREFQSALKRVFVACSKDDTRPVLQRVQVIASPSRVRLQAADGFRLHREDLFDDSKTWSSGGWITDRTGKLQNEINVLLDPVQINALLKVKISRKDDPTLTIDPAAGKIRIDGKPTAGTFDTESIFPQVDVLFPKGPSIQVKVKSADLLAALKTARVYSREGSNVVQLHISDSIVVHAKSEALGESWTVVTPEHLRRVSRHDFVVAFNVDNLLGYLKVAGESVRIDLFLHNSPVVFQGAAGDDFTGLIMPYSLDVSTQCLTPADIPAPKETPVTDAAEYYSESDAWKLSHTVKHSPDYGTHYAGGVIRDDIWTSTPEPGAVVYDLRDVYAYHVEPDFGRGKGIGLIALHCTDERPDPNAPIPADGWPLPHRHPLIASESITVGECTRCTDPNHHALYDGLCGSCQAEQAELEKSHR